MAMRARIGSTPNLNLNLNYRKWKWNVVGITRRIATVTTAGPQQRSSSLLALHYQHTAALQISMSHHTYLRHHATLLQHHALRFIATKSVVAAASSKFIAPSAIDTSDETEEEEEKVEKKKKGKATKASTKKKMMKAKEEVLTEADEGEEERDEKASKKTKGSTTAKKSKKAIVIEAENVEKGEKPKKKKGKKEETAIPAKKTSKKATDVATAIIQEKEPAETATPAKRTRRKTVTEIAAAIIEEKEPAETATSSKKTRKRKTAEVAAAAAATIEENETAKTATPAKRTRRRKTTEVASEQEEGKEEPKYPRNDRKKKSLQIDLEASLDDFKAILEKERAETPTTLPINVPSKTLVDAWMERFAPPVRFKSTKKMLDYYHIDKNYLVDVPAAERFFNELGDVNERCVVEFLPGPGVLSTLLVNAGAYVVGLEFMNASYAPKLPLHFVKPQRYETIYDQGLGFELAAMTDANLFRAMDNCPFVDSSATVTDQDVEKKRVLITGTLPVRNGERLLNKIISGFSSFTGLYSMGLADCHLLLHELIVKRMFAKPGDPEYCKLSVLVHGFFDVKVISDDYEGHSIQPETIPGKYSHIEFVPKPSSEVLVSFAEYEKVLRMLFKKKSSPILESAATLAPIPDMLLEGTDIHPKTKVALLTREQFYAIAVNFSNSEFKELSREL